MLPPFLNAADLDERPGAVVDDVADTGMTLELVHEFCAGHVAEARTAVLYEKPQSIIDADYAWRRTDRWINFPWSSERAGRLPAAGRRPDRRLVRAAPRAAALRHVGFRRRARTGCE